MFGQLAKITCCRPITRLGDADPAHIVFSLSDPLFARVSPSVDGAWRLVLIVKFFVFTSLRRDHMARLW